MSEKTLLDEGETVENEITPKKSKWVARECSRTFCKYNRTETPSNEISFPGEFSAKDR
jgi:hypothetical protein